MEHMLISNQNYDRISGDVTSQGSYGPKQTSKAVRETYKIYSVGGLRGPGLSTAGLGDDSGSFITGLNNKPLWMLLHYLGLNVNEIRTSD